MSYIDSIVAYISKLQLTLTQWVILGVAVVISGLVGALKIQGGRLHKAQIQLLESHMQAVNQADDAAIKVARDRFNQALQAYRNAQ